VKIRTDTGKRRAHINIKARQDGRPGLVISQGGSAVLMSRREWLAIRQHADALLGIKGEQ
jgi:hypothetical protein